MSDTMTMDLAQEIATLSEAICLSVLGLPLHLSTSGAGTLPSGRTVDGIVTITGDFQGAVILQMPEALARRVASIMFSLGDATPTLEGMQDARSARSRT